MRRFHGRPSPDEALDGRFDSGCQPHGFGHRALAKFRPDYRTAKAAGFYDRQQCNEAQRQHSDESRVGCAPVTALPPQHEPRYDAGQPEKCECEQRRVAMGVQ